MFIYGSELEIQPLLHVDTLARRNLSTVMAIMNNLEIDAIKNHSSVNQWHKRKVSQNVKKDE